MNLSNLLEEIRVDRANWAVVELAAPGGIRFPRGLRTYLYLVISGNAVLQSPPQPPVSLRSGDAALVLQGDAHWLADASGSPMVTPQYFAGNHDRMDKVPVIRVGGTGATTRIVVCAFRLRLARTHPLMVAVPRIVHVKADGGPGHSADTPPLVQEVGAIVAEAGAVAYLNRLAELLLVRAFRSLVLKAAHEGLIDAGLLSQPGVASALRLMRTRFEESWTLERLAHEVGMSRTAFAAEFRAATGSTPMSHLAELRMREAARLLTTSQQRMLEVARNVGYESEAAFARAFKRSHGMSPASFRRSRRPGAASAALRWFPFFFADGETA